MERAGGRGFGARPAVEEPDVAPVAEEPECHGRREAGGKGAPTRLLGLAVPAATG